MVKRAITIALLLVLTAVTACGKKKELPKPASDDFESLSGKALPTWEYVQTKDDKEYLAFFKGIYEANKGLMKQRASGARIPRVVHFIWMGPRPFPRESVENVRTWMAKNPDWTFKFWTDRERPAPCPGMQTKFINDFKFLQLSDCFSKGDNFGEKSDVLRLEILYQEGGVYVDHDVKCFKAFDQLNGSYDFYCGIDMPYKSSLPSCVFTTNNLIGVKPCHPIIKHCMDQLAEKWDKIGQEYPGADRDAMLNRTLHRTFWQFGDSFRHMNNQDGNRDIVFPAYYFDAPDETLAMWARHQYAGAWHETENPFEKMVRERLMYLSKKSNMILLFAGVMSGLNLLAFAVLVILFKSHRRFVKSNKADG